MSRPPLGIVVSTPRVGSSWTASLLARNPALNVLSHDSIHTYAMYALHPLRSLAPGASDVHVPGEGVATRARGWAVRRWLRARGRPGRQTVIASPTALMCCSLFERELDVRYVWLQRSPAAVVASMAEFMRGRQTAGYRQRARAGRSDTAWRGTAIRVVAHAFHRWRWRRSGRGGGYIGLRPAPLRSRRSLPDLDFVAWYHNALSAWIEAFFDRIPSDRVLVVRYEDLVADPEAVLTEIVTFLGGSADEAYFEAVRPRLPKRKSPTAPLTADADRAVGLALARNPATPEGT